MRTGRIGLGLSFAQNVNARCFVGITCHMAFLFAVFVDCPGNDVIISL